MLRRLKNHVSRFDFDRLHSTILCHYELVFWAYHSSSAPLSLLPSNLGSNFPINDQKLLSICFSFSDSNARLLAESSSYNLPSLLQSQTRIKPTFKGPTPMKKDMRVDMTNPFTIMSYRPERSDNIDSRKPIIKGQNLNRKGKAPQKTVVASNQTRYLNGCILNLSSTM